MKKLLVYLKGYKKETILAPLFKMLEATFELFVPLVMSGMIDIGIANHDKHDIYMRCLLLLGLALIGLICSITAQFYAAKAAVGFSTAMKHSLYAHIQRLSFNELDQLGSSTMITRMTSDANQVQNGVNMVLRLFLRSPFIVIGAMVMAFTIDMKAAFVFVVTIPALCIVVFGIMMISIPLYRKVQAGLDQVLGITRENLTGARVIRAFNKEEAELKQFDAVNNRLTGMQMFVGRISSLMNPVTYIIINLATVVLIYIGALQVNVGNLTQGNVVALVNYMSQILVELVKLANLIITVTKAVACANRIQSVFDQQPSMENGGLAEKTEQSDIAVRFDHVSLQYQRAAAETLTDLDFTVHRGETIGIIGGTGSGKSSLVHLIPRFYDVTSGQVLINGIDVKDYRLETLREKIGIVLQKAVLFKGTIRSNLLWGRENATDEQLWEALEISQAKEFVETKTGKLDAEIAQTGKNLSGGQKQRLTIARALVKNPEILILDDSASALDYATDAKLRFAIQRMKSRPTVFIVSQRTASIMHADQIIVLEDGAVAGIGTHESLLESCSVYREIYESQFRKEELT